LERARGGPTREREQLKPAAAAALPTIEQLDDFLCALRQADFKIGPDQMAGAQKILLLALAEADGGLAARRLKTMLAPIVARSPTQQAEFYRRFEALTAAIELAPAGAAPAAGPIARRRLAAIAAAAALLLAIAGGLWLFQPAPPAPPPRSPVPEGPSVAAVTVPIARVPFVTAALYRRPGYAAARAGLIALPLLLFGGWMAWRWRRRVLWLERHPGMRDPDPAVVRLPAQDQPLFPAAALSAIALDLRRHLRVPSRDLDVDRTIPETLDAGGSFAPVWQTVPRSPSYLFLIEKESAHDHVAGILDGAVERLVGEDVAIERYHFRGDPRWLLGAEDRRGIEPIADVAARHGDHRLVVVAGGDGLFEPLTDRLEPGVEEALAQWRPRAVLSTKPMQSWSWRELALVGEGGFDLATASYSGLRALAQRAAAEPDRAAELLEGVIVSMPASPPTDYRMTATRGCGLQFKQRDALVPIRVENEGEQFVTMRREPFAVLLSKEAFKDTNIDYPALGVTVSDKPELFLLYRNDSSLFFGGGHAMADYGQGSPNLFSLEDPPYGLDYNYIYGSRFNIDDGLNRGKYVAAIFQRYEQGGINLLQDAKNIYMIFQLAQSEDDHSIDLVRIDFR
jgi:hypothetical protein